ncbi:tRNA pseudouridine(38-40) synthase TruA [Stratiformator vulcanicus]|uniref:tRNA pseudouridine synthase A n=1 Tax=Stratiformator vulcanicus TaxID=2527980 RepID=A0A517QWT7_9PLAN|nr:tRNA pseudouridine(38-40) synthase TruA [Stratiformator vulcanicus]QDT36135.1 tRNA pseudouridine synthase A [Stratiformator vulcanicus]
MRLPVDAVRNIRIRLAYDGTNYAGWQVQPDQPTIQQAVETAVFELAGERVSVFSSGRTDAGVHAIGQVANFRFAGTLPLKAFQPGLNQHLPDDISVLAADQVPLAFHSSYWAERKTYRYLIYLSRSRHPLLRCRAWQERRRVDAEQMSEAAALLEGTHDFRCFETQGSPRSDTVRTIYRCRVARLPMADIWQTSDLDDQSRPADLEPMLLAIEVTGNGFLYNMVRAIAGTLVDVGIGKQGPDHVSRLIASGDRALAGATASAEGLYLVRVEYDEARIERELRSE